SLTVLSRILVDLKLLGSRMSNIMIAGSLIADTLGLMLFGIYVGVVSADSLQPMKILTDILLAILFFGVVFWLGVRVFPWLGNLLKKTGFNERRANFTLVIVIGLSFALLAEAAGLHAILGAFLAGLFLRGEVLARKLSHEVTSMVHDFALGFLAPIFFVMAGFHIKLEALATHWQLALVVLGLALLGKTLGSFICFLVSRNRWRESLVISVGMNIHGTVEIILAEIAYKEKLIGADLFSIIVVVALVTTAIVPMFLKRGVASLQKRGELTGNDENRRGVLIVGAPALARFIAKAFQGYEPVWLIERNANRCLAAEADGLNVLRGDALQEDVLELLDAANTRVFLAATTNNQVNEQALHHAKHLYGIPECYRLFDDKEENQAGDKEHEFPALYGPGWEVGEWMARIDRKETDIETWPVEEASPMSAVDVRLKNMGILPLAVNRDGRRQVHSAVDQ
ncbi:MAG: cation:proton antiporter, partial [Verrucomicrobiota bacterium]